MSERKFDSSYRESLTLRDGGEVELRLVQREDRELLERGFEKLSDRSRYLRFFTAKPHLTAAEVSYLTDVDGETHFAIGASRRGASGVEEGVAVARFIRLPVEPEVAEAAVTVLDEMQGKGLGSVLLLRLIAAARERGVRAFRCWLLAENRDMQALIHEWLPGAHERLEGAELVIDAPLPEVGPAEPTSTRPVDHPLYRMLRHAASGAVTVLGLGRWIPGAHPAPETDPPASRSGEG